MTSILLFILILSLLVIIHEMGHLLVAKWQKVRVNEFGLGYPPRALKLFTVDGTLFSLNWVPFGGFVKLEGEDGEVVDSKTPKNGEMAFFEQTALAKLLIVLAGPVVNFIFGIIAFAIVFSISGIPQTLNSQPRIDQIMPGSPAEVAKLPTSVNIIGFSEAADGEVTATPKIADVQSYVQAHKGQTVTVKLTGACKNDSCEESVSTHQLYLRKDQEIPENQGSMGLVFSEYYTLRYPWYLMPLYSSWYGVTQALQMGWMMVQGLGQIVSDIFTSGKVTDEVAGPIGIVHQAQKSNILTSGWLMVLSFSGMLSINLAVMNVLPIPALDGGRALFILLGVVLGQKRIEKLENYANYGGFFALIGLIILISLRDIQRIIQGG